VSVRVEVANRSGWRVDENATADVMRAALAGEGVTDGEVGVAFVPEEEMAALNLEHRAVDKPTDVLSFPLDLDDDLPPGLPRQLGDVVVCPQVADRDGTPVATLLVHGALHLVGYDHATDDGSMLARQDELLAGVVSVGAAPA
jgi:probable rRNA maturation factor